MAGSLVSALLGEKGGARLLAFRLWSFQCVSERVWMNESCEGMKG